MVNMTQSRRKRPAKPPTGNVKDVTLDQFSAQLDEEAGEAVGFATAVKALARTREQQKQVKAAREAVKVHVTQAYDIGHRAVSGTPYEIRMSEPGEPTPYRSVTSDVVKARNPEAWRRNHAVANFVQVKPPSVFLSAVKHVDVPADKDFMPPAEAVITLEEHPAFAWTTRALADAEREAIERLDKLAADFGWDGGAADGPLVFTDGWVVQLKRMQFSGEKLAELEPDVFEELAVTKVKQSAPYLYIRKAAPEDQEFGEIDGD